MAHQPMDDFLRNYIHRDPWDPTGWGVLPWEPTDRDRRSNKEWDEYKYDDQYWEDYVRINDYEEEVPDRRLIDPNERRFLMHDRKGLMNTIRHHIGKIPGYVSHITNFKKTELNRTDYQMSS